jgi:prepilin-type N-terminal cleavage/methylation domain-containing protein
VNTREAPVWRSQARATFTLIELLVVIAIIGVLASMLLPALQRALDTARQAQCDSNLRQIYIAACGYGGDNNGWMGHVQRRYQNGTLGGTPEDIKTKFGPWYCRAPSQADAYIAGNYLALSTNYKGYRGNDVLNCPQAMARYGPIFGGLVEQYAGNDANVECHYTFSVLMVSNTDDLNVLAVRTNEYGPYRGEELPSPSLTFYAGDAWMDNDNPSAGWSRAFGKDFNAGWITGWGAAHPCIGAFLINEWVPAIEYTHGRPSAAAFDGHIEHLRVPATFDTTAAAALAKFFTRGK